MAALGNWNDLPKTNSPRLHRRATKRHNQPEPQGAQPKLGALFFSPNHVRTAQGSTGIVGATQVSCAQCNSALLPAFLVTCARP